MPALHAPDVQKGPALKFARIFVDGASRGNPGDASIGVSLQDEQAQEIESISLKIGVTTNNFAEYTALLEALKLAQKKSFNSLEVYSDSELMVRQINGQYKVKDATLKILWAQAKELISVFDAFKISHVRREQNKRADELANQALDS